MAFTPEQLPSGRWRSGFRTPDGRKVQRTFDYAHQAQAWAEGEEARTRALRAGAPLEAPQEAPGAAQHTSLGQQVTGTTVGAYGAAWHARLGHLARGTRDGYATHLRAIARYPISGMDLGAVRRSDVRAWVTSMTEQGAGRPTVNARLKVLRMLFRDAVHEGVAPVDPTHGVELLSVPLRQDGVLTPEQDARLVAAAADSNHPWMRAMVLLGLDAGLRWQEAAGLPASAVVGDYLIVRQVVERSTRSVRQDTKSHRLRVVPIATDRLAAALRPLVLAADPDALLFTNSEGGPLDYDNWVKRVWRPLRRRAGLPRGARFHDLRHTCGSRMGAYGAPRKEIAQVLGHADEGTTARYIHAGDDGRRLALMREALNGGQAPTAAGTGHRKARRALAVVRDQGA